MNIPILHNDAPLSFGTPLNRSFMKTTESFASPTSFTIEASSTVKGVAANPPHRSIVGVAYLQKKFSLTGDASNGQVREETRQQQNSTRGRESQRAQELRGASESLHMLEKAYQDCCLTLFYSRMWYGPTINCADNQIGRAHV